MLISTLKSKISYAKLTQTELYYEGSITIDEDIMEKANLRENELVHIVNLNNAARMETYVIRGARGSRIIGLNGPAARNGVIGDYLHILSYAQVDPEKETVEPVIVDLKQT
jgi:aspartate 1-decarboxylase